MYASACSSFLDPFWRHCSEASKLTLPQPYFLNPFVFADSNCHLVVCVHGLEGNAPAVLLLAYFVGSMLWCLCGQRVVKSTVLCSCILYIT